MRQTERLTLRANVHGLSFGEVSGGDGTGGTLSPHQRPLFHAHEYKDRPVPRSRSGGDGVLHNA